MDHTRQYVAAFFFVLMTAILFWCYSVKLPHYHRRPEFRKRLWRLLIIHSVIGMALAIGFGYEGLLLFLFEYPTGLNYLHRYEREW